MNKVHLIRLDFGTNLRHINNFGTANEEIVRSSHAHINSPAGKYTPKNVVPISEIDEFKNIKEIKAGLDEFISYTNIKKWEGDTNEQCDLVGKCLLQVVKKELIFTDVEQDYVSISTPFIDTNFDNINLYARIINQDQVEVSDFGYTITNLEELGITLNKRSKTVWRIYESALNDFGINREDEALIIRTSLDRFPIAKNRLLQGIMRINDISYLSKGNVKAAFNDIVEEYFINNGILYTPNVEIANGNGIASRFDFSIPSKSGIEHLVKTTARPNDPNYAKTFNFDVKATKPKRPRANLSMF